MASSAGSDLVIENGLASGAGPSPRICGAAGPPWDCAVAAEALIMTVAQALNQGRCFTVPLDYLELDGAAGGVPPI